MSDSITMFSNTLGCSLNKLFCPLLEFRIGRLADLGGLDVDLLVQVG